jgi:signal transduction histidine kinase
MENACYEPPRKNSVWLLFAVLLTAVFLCELAIMAILPLIFPRDRSMVAEALVDASLLTLVIAPFLVLWAVRPLQRLLAVRSRLLALNFQAQDAERQRIARDLHDEIGQMITSLQIGLKVIEDSPNLAEAAQRARELRAIAAEAHDDVRRLAQGLHPATLEKLGLAAGLEHLVEDFHNQRGIAISLDITPPGCCRGTGPISVRQFSSRKLHLRSWLISA